MLSKQAKKRLGRLCKKLDKIQPKVQLKNLINCGVRVDERFGESFKCWWIFKGNDVEEVKATLYRHGVPIEGHEIHSIYDCTGQRFYNPADFKVLKDRVFVTQSGGLDV